VKRYAGFWRRAGAFALDYILIFAYLVVLTLLFLLLNMVFDVSQLFAGRVQAQFSGFLLVTLPVVLYFASSESSLRQATWGKQRMKLKVADRNEKRISFWRALGRTLLKFVPWEISHTLVWQIYFSPQIDSVWIDYGFVLVYLLIGLNAVLLGMARMHQTLYDLLTKTYVMEKY
jgi:uncharacterized RDD family membrane protein YckC